MRDMSLSELPLEAQIFLEECVERFIPRHRSIYRWFDVYDLEENRL